MSSEDLFDLEVFVAGLNSSDGATAAIPLRHGGREQRWFRQVSADRVCFSGRHIKIEPHIVATAFPSTQSIAAASQVAPDMIFNRPFLTGIILRPDRR